MRAMRGKLLPLFGALVCLILAGCNGGSSNSDAPKTAPAAEQVVPGPVRGSVITDAPVAGAVVQLYTHDGHPLPGDAITDDNGEFEIAVEEARYGLRVVATGGSTANGGQFVGTLSSYVEPFDAELSVPVNPVTTMADRLRINAGLSGDEAEHRIATYLSLTPGRSPRADFRHLRDFNSGVFMASTTEYGFDGLVDQLVAEAAEDPEATRRFSTGLQVPMLASAIGMELIKGAVNQTGSRLAGKVLASLGLGGSGVDVSAILEKLEAISQQLSALQATVDDIARDVKELKVNLAVEVAKDLINDIRTLWFDLENLDRFSGATLEAEKQRIFNEIDKLYAKRMLISNMFNGNLGTTSPIQLYAEFLRDTNRFYSMQHYNKLHDFIEFYDALSIQLYYLLIEAENWRMRDSEEPSQRVPALAAEIENARDRYRARLPAPLPNDSTFIETSNLVMWYGKREAIPFPGPINVDNRHHMPVAGSEKVPERLLPPELRSLGQWILPTQADLERGFMGRQAAIIARGAPAHLFPNKAMNIWTGPANKPLFFRTPITTTLAVNESKFNVTSIDELNADLFARRQLTREEARDNWAPWLYPERAGN